MNFFLLGGQENTRFKEKTGMFLHSSCRTDKE